MVPFHHRRVIFVAHLDLAGEEGYLATWRKVLAKVSHSMVGSTLKADAIIPSPNVFSTNRNTIQRRYPFVFFLSVGIIPLSLWIWTTEATLWFLEDSPMPDTKVSGNFGQVFF